MRPNARYLDQPTLNRGSAYCDLLDVLALVREHYPAAAMEGSAGLGRMFLQAGTRDQVVAVCWSSGKTNEAGELLWHHRVLAHPQRF